MNYCVCSVMMQLFVQAFMDRLTRRSSKIPSFQLDTGKTAGWLVGWLVGKSCLSRVACLSACGRGPPGPSVCAVRSTAAVRISTAGEARQRRVYNTKEVCYTC